jgi:hypothetical protein
LALYWPLQESSGSTAYDFSGNGNSGSGGASPAGKWNLLNTTTWYSSGSDTISTGLSNLSIDKRSTTGWFHPDWSSGSGNKVLFSLQGRNFSVHYNNNSNSGGYELLSQGTSIPSNVSRSNQWIFVAITYDGFKGRIYIDGVQEGGGAGASSVTGDGTFEMYKASPEGKNSAGYCSDVRHYDYALSSSEIQYLYDVVNTNSSLTTDYRTG